MLKQSQLKIKRFLKYIRNSLPNDIRFGGDADLGDDLPEIEINLQTLPDNELLEFLRVCPCCKEQIVTKEQQLHAILEFDTPLRAFNAMYAHLEDEVEEV